MFFPEKIKSIKKIDKVLEIGPGNTPYFRSDILLEKVFDDEDTAKLQAGGTKKKDLKKEIIYYTEDKFPFKDNEFDYVICSHVLEHIPIEFLELFIKELQRVASKGYIEIPLYSYEVFTNIEHHLSFLNVDENNKLYFLKKNDSDFDSFVSKEVNNILEKSKFKSRIINNNLDKLVCGFEWDEGIKYEIVDNFSILTSKSTIKFEDIKLSNFYKYKNKIYTMLNKNRLYQMLYQRFGLLV